MFRAAGKREATAWEAVPGRSPDVLGKLSVRFSALADRHRVCLLLLAAPHTVAAVHALVACAAADGDRAADVARRRIAH